MGVRNRNYLTRFQDKSRSLSLLAGDTPTTVGADFIAGRAGYTIYLLSIKAQVLTAAAQRIDFQDDAATPVIFASLPASAAVGDEHVLLNDLNGPGVPITEGKNLDIAGTAGVGARIEVVAYLKQTGTITAANL